MFGIRIYLFWSWSECQPSQIPFADSALYHALYAILLYMQRQDIYVEGEKWTSLIYPSSLKFTQ